MRQAIEEGFILDVLGAYHLQDLPLLAVGGGRPDLSISEGGPALARS